MAQKKTSAGILPFRQGRESLEILLGHPGGPFWQRKDLGAWTVIKGEYGPDEQPLAAARREFTEETGWIIQPPFLVLPTIQQKGGKLVTAWAARADFNPDTLVSNTFSIEWPPRSGNQREFPELNSAAWFSLAQARQKILPSQLPLVDYLGALLGE